MKLNLDCIPCFQRQALETSRIARIDTKTQEMLLRKIMEELIDAEWNDNSWSLALRVHQLVRRITGVKDPYREIKQKHNQMLLDLYPLLKQRINSEKEPLFAAVKLSIGGNIIDFGPPENKFNLKAILEGVLEKKLAINDYQAFKKRLEQSKKILLFADNAGEIVLDKLLLETILNTKDIERISLVVKGGPFINDATLEDVKQVDLTSLDNLKVLTLSNGDPQSGVKYNSETITTWMKEHDMTICKGQGNYEALDNRKDTFFLLIAKCPLVASHLGTGVGNFILKYNPRRERSKPLLLTKRSV